MKWTISQKLVMLFCAMAFLFVSFTLYVNHDLGMIEASLEQGIDREVLLKRVERSENMVVFVLIAGFFVCAGILYYLRSMSNSITKPLTSLVAAANEIAGGNLSVKISDTGAKNEVGELAADFNKMVTNLREIIGNVKDNVAQLASAAEEMAVSSTQIVGGSQEQSEKSMHVATATQELSETIIDVARNAAGAADTATKANTVAMSGGEIVNKSIGSINGIADLTRKRAGMMSDLGERSNQVGAIIKVIEDIASQTNLLALNAAIEAARAGDQGRGFAVVADEVRKLAEKTTRATKEIGDTVKMIQEYTNNAVISMRDELSVVEEGVGFAKNAGNALGEIVSQVESVTALVSQIAIAAEQQSTAANQISGDVEVVSQISGSSAESARHIASSSQNIAILAADLQVMIDKFRVS